MIQCITSIGMLIGLEAYRTYYKWYPDQNSIPTSRPATAVSVCPSSLQCVVADKAEARHRWWPSEYPLSAHPAGSVHPSLSCISTTSIHAGINITWSSTEGLLLLLLLLLHLESQHTWRDQVSTTRLCLWDCLHRCNYTILHYTILYYTILYSTTLYYASYVMLCYSMLARCCRRWLNRLIQEHTGSDFRSRRPMVLYSPLLLLQDIACMCHFHCSNLFHYDASSQ